MKRYFLISVMALGIALSAAAQGSTTDYPARVELVKVQSAWFHSSNAAGLSIDPLARYNDLSFGYSLGRGDFRLQPEGNTNSLDIATSGATSLGRGQVWGSFNYRNLSAKDTRFNTMTLNLEDDLPFIVSDANVSPWKKQRYDMSMKAATPLLGDLAALGISANYFTESGAKQVDPRCTDYEYGITAEPSVVFQFGGHTLGLTGTYRNGGVREVPVNSNSQQDQVAYILRGLGNYTDAVVGSLSGISTFYYKRNLYGGALQYGFGGRGLKLLAEGGYSYQLVDAFQTPTKPQRMGSTIQQKIFGKAQVLAESETVLGKVTVEGFHRTTDGVEFLQELGVEWQTIDKNIRSHYDLWHLALGYDFFRKGEVGYSWMAGVRGAYDEHNDKYILPASEMTYKNVTGELYAKKNWLIGDVTVLAGLHGAFRKNLGAVYQYGGAEPTSVIILEFYHKDFEYKTAHCWKGGASVNVAFPIGGRTAMFCQLEGDYLKPLYLESKRLFAKLTVGFTF
ncbi:MAG: hypothetical protein IKG90_07540 [Bacteroidales bacterium]|nr:hypothetical protein [Bacteroidales bacterium]